MHIYTDYVTDNYADKPLEKLLVKTTSEKTY